MTSLILRFLLIALALITVPSILKAGLKEEAAKQAGAAYDAEIARLDKEISEAKAAVEQKRAEIKRLEGELTGERGSVTLAQNALNQANQALATKRNNARGGTTSADFDKAAKDLAIAEQQQEAAEKTYNESAAKVAKLDAEIQKYNQEAKRIEERLKKSGWGFGSPTGLEPEKASQVAAQGEAIKKMEASVDNLEADIRKANVSAKLQELKSDIKDAELKYAILENTYNQGLIGDFLRMKMEGLLRDKAFCEATKACASGEKTQPDLKPLFSSTARDRAKKDEESHK